MNILLQKIYKVTYGGERLYIENEKLLEVIPLKYETYIDDKNNIHLVSSNTGKNLITKKTKKGIQEKVVGVIDRTNKEIKEVLKTCQNIKVTFLMDDNGGKVVIEAIKETAKLVKEYIPNKENLTCITFCAGAGIASKACKMSGFKEVGAVEYNPKEGSEDKFADIYLKYIHGIPQDYYLGDSKTVAIQCIY